MRRIAVLDAPSNLGLRPPTATSVPGCAKAPGALRDHGVLRRLNARDAGCLTPPRYDPGDWRPGDGVCHASEIAAYSRKLADRIGAILDLGEFPVILGGDCSILIGSALAMHRLGEAVGGRIGLVFVDGHSDFRHPGNASYVGAAAGEDLALVTGRGQTDLAAIEGRRPYYRDIDVVVMGIRAQDEYRLDLQAAGIVTRPVPTLRAEGAARSAQWARDQLVDCAGYWVHVDVDVLDPAVMPAVDAPEPGGIAFPELELLLAGLVESPHCLGVEITVFDPDYDPDGAYAEEITSTIVAGLQSAQAVDARPDLVAARRDLLAPGKLAPASEPDRFAARRSAAAADDVRLAAGIDDRDDIGGDIAPATALPDDAVALLDDAVALPDDGVALPEDAVALRDLAVALLDGAVALPEEAGAVPEGPVADDRPESDSTAGGPAAAQPPTESTDDGSDADGDAGPGPADDPGADGDEAGEDDDQAELRAATRPLGPAPLLDSKPLPATMPGMLRPRAAEDFTLPAQRPAFEIGPEQPADLA